MEVYTVFGTVGEYSDNQHWAIATYFNEDLAKEHVVKATEIAYEIAFLYNNLYRDSLSQHRGLTEAEKQESSRISQLNVYDSETQDWLDKHTYYYETTNVLDEVYRRKII